MSRTRQRLLLVALSVLVGLAPGRSQAPAPVSRNQLLIYLARHGESTANATNTMVGVTDVPLTDRGRQQANELATVMKGLPLDAIYSSSLTRSRATAEAVAAGRPVNALDQFRERNVGTFEGTPINGAELSRRRFLEGDNLDGGETRAAFLERVRAGLDQVKREHPTGSVLIVGHAGTNSRLLRVLMNLNDEQANAIDQANDEVYAVDLREGQPPRLWKLVTEKNLRDL